MAALEYAYAELDKFLALAKGDSSLRSVSARNFWTLVQLVEHAWERKFFCPDGEHPYIENTHTPISFNHHLIYYYDYQSYYYRGVGIRVTCPKDPDRSPVRKGIGDIPISSIILFMYYYVSYSSYYY